MATPALLETPLTPFDRAGDLPLALGLVASAIAAIRSRRQPA
jgi:hypothetical protein